MKLCKSNIEWVLNSDGTQGYGANPVRGKCPHFGTKICGYECPITKEWKQYCYAERQRVRFKQPEKLSFHPEVLEAIERLRNPSTIFMGSHIDLFANNIPANWLTEIINTTLGCQQHSFIFCTKNPYRYRIFFDSYRRILSPKIYLGTTETGLNDTLNILLEINDSLPHPLFVSAEPLLRGFELPLPLEGFIIGAMTGKGAVKPKKEWVLDLIRQADEAGVKVFIKDNLLNIYPDLPKRRELIWKSL